MTGRIRQARALMSRLPGLFDTGGAFATSYPLTRFLNEGWVSLAGH